MIILKVIAAIYLSRMIDYGLKIFVIWLAAKTLPDGTFDAISDAKIRANMIHDPVIREKALKTLDEDPTPEQLEKIQNRINCILKDQGDQK